jgi:hypothetical protein
MRYAKLQSSHFKTGMLSTDVQNSKAHVLKWVCCPLTYIFPLLSHEDYVNHEKVEQILDPIQDCFTLFDLR